MKDNRRWQAPQFGLRERLAQRRAKSSTSYYNEYTQDYKQPQALDLPYLLTKHWRENQFQKTVAAIIVIICLGAVSLFNTPLTNRVVDWAYQLTVKQTNPTDIIAAAQPVLASLRDFSWRQQSTTEDPLANETVTTLDGMVAPVNGELSSPYGARIITGSNEMEMHYGIDVSAEPGSPVYAALAGTVTVVDPAHPVLGETIYLQHVDDTVTIYGRVTGSLVIAGDQVAQGAEIAKIAAAEGESHLHFEVWQEKQPVDPEPYLKQTN
ncbi:MAG TPA: M23 family metallopeptidase [Oscillospiraceae bacterium]|nr:M23 family metallopeptidase [Oscillospiraceae bacterium]